MKVSACLFLHCWQSWCCPGSCHPCHLRNRNLRSLKSPGARFFAQVDLEEKIGVPTNWQAADCQDLNWSPDHKLARVCCD